ncbi:delta-1-pyrroline-5-carboxylate synthase [Trifolium repens]|nr:delta-1-pyrroline-5-carboxylate synthase [Trifolium repens]
MQGPLATPVLQHLTKDDLRKLYFGEFRVLDINGSECFLARTAYASLLLCVPQGDLDGKACAAVGQSSLMALYDTMFSQLDVTSSQLLVNDGFFKGCSTRKAPYEDSSGIFWDNDSLAGLLALKLKADLVLLSDVEGLYIISCSLLLIRHGADVDVEDKEGYKVLGRVTDDGFRSSIMIDAAKTMLE